MTAPTNAAGLIKPRPVEPGGTVGICTPSTPLHTVFGARFATGIANLERLGLRVVLGDLTASGRSQGYRTAGGRERADEFNELVRREDVGLIMSTIGGWNSSSLLEHLDYDAIRTSRTILSGSSDVTSLHMAITTRAGLSTLYGPAVLPSFGDPGGPAEETAASFLDQVMHGWTGTVAVPERWSVKGPGWSDADHAAADGGERGWNPHEGLRCVQPGRAAGPALAANLNTLVCLAGTPYFPVTAGRILFLEEMSCPLSRFERNLTQMRLAGAFDGVLGIVLSRPEVYDAEGAPFDDAALLVEVLDDPSIPVLSRFDAGHTHPMMSMPQGAAFEIEAVPGGDGDGDGDGTGVIRQMEAFTACVTGGPSGGARR